MNIKTITFSPTGGTKAVADILARTLDPDPFDIDLTDRFADHEQVALAADDLVVIAMPCFCGRVPVLAAERFAHIRGNGARAVIVAVYGNRDFDDELVELGVVHGTLLGLEDLDPLELLPNEGAEFLLRRLDGLLVYHLYRGWGWFYRI